MISAAPIEADRCYGFTQKGGREHDRRKRLEVADDGDGLDGQLGDGAKVEKATDAGVDDAEHSDGAPINTGGDAGGQERGSALRDEREDQCGVTKAALTWSVEFSRPSMCGAPLLAMTINA